MAMICAYVSRVVETYPSISRYSPQRGYTMYLSRFTGTDAAIEAQFQGLTASATATEVDGIIVYKQRDLPGMNRIERSFDVVFPSGDDLKKVEALIRKFACIIDDTPGDLPYGGVHGKAGQVLLSFVGNHLEQSRQPKEARDLAEVAITMIKGVPLDTL